MKPKKLKLVGFAGIASGRGQNEINLDLDLVVPAESMIIALAGPNGSGKTTIMDNLHPYRVMPSRSSTPTPTAFSYYDHIVDGEGLKELIWEHEGRVYKSSIRIRATAKTKKQEAYLFDLSTGSETPYTHPESGLTSDGKTDTYDQCIELILGKPEVFFATQFSAQGKKPIGAMTASEVKSLIAEMLDMSKLKSLSAKAGTIHKSAKPFLEQYSQEIMKLQGSLPDVTFIDKRLEDIDMDKAAIQAAIQASTQKIAQIKITSDQLDTSLAQQAAIAEQHRAIDERLALTQSQAQTTIQELLQAHGTQRSSLEQQVASAKSNVEMAKTHKSRIAARYREAQALLEKKAELEAAKLKKTELIAKKLSKENEMSELSLDVHRLTQVRSDVSNLREELSKAAQDGKHLAAVLASIEQTAALLHEVPCQGTELSGRCKLLTQARDAAQTVEVKRVEISALRKGYATKNGNFEIIQRELQRLESSEEKSRALQIEVNAIQQQLDMLQPILMLATQIEGAQSTLDETTREGLEAKASLENAEQVLSELTQNLESLQQIQAAELARQQAAGEMLIQEIKTSKSMLPALVDSSTKDKLVTELQQAQDELSQSNKRLDQLDVEVDGLKAQKARAHLMQEAIASNKAKADALSKEISYWALLAKALGTDGIIAMSIDDSGPHVAHIANQLLKDCYGGRFVVSLLTQAQTASGVQKEVFQIQVEDTQRGETKLLDEMSGGEKVWINECLVRALSLYMTQSTGRHVSTLFSDESDGALDPERKRQYMAMKRAVLTQGGYDREFLITQTPELLTMCDAVVDVTKL